MGLVFSVHSLSLPGDPCVAQYLYHGANGILFRMPWGHSLNSTWLLINLLVIEPGISIFGKSLSTYHMVSWILESWVGKRI
jgi:hypothetical protein